MFNMGIDWAEVFRRALKYLFEGLAVALAAIYLIKGASMEQVFMVAVSAAAIYSVLDMYSPSIGSSARLGSGLQIGSSLLGGF